jgi:acetoin utilization deacetylase AcuC-like enzyme
MQKYAMLREQLLAERIVAPEAMHVPPAASDADILRAHDASYLWRVQRGELTPHEIRRIGFPWSPELVERSRRSSGATIAACRAALTDGCAANLAGGTHHACRDHGEGYCVFNDSVIAARALQHAGQARCVAVIDCDVHQGNGTAAICADDPSIFTLSLHGAKNFPFRKEQSDLDIALDDGVADDVYLDALWRGVHAALEQARPDLAIYVSGADPFVGDRLGRLALSKAGLAERDRIVLHYCRTAGIPVAISMAGGYARQVQDTVDIHVQTVRVAVEMQHTWVLPQ